MMIALPNQDESWTVTLFMPFVLFDSLKSAEEVIDFFRANFADALPLIGYDNLVRTFFHSKYQPLISVKVQYQLTIISTPFYAHPRVGTYFDVIKFIRICVQTKGIIRLLQIGFLFRYYKITHIELSLALI